jgi:hypothetical protein
VELVSRVWIPFLATAPNELAGYHLFIAQNVSLGFEIDKKGNATGTKIKDSGQQKLLEKVNKKNPLRYVGAKPPLQ